MRIARPGVKCDGPVPSAVYFANGRAVAELYSCESILDEPTREAVEEINAILAAAASAR